MKRLRRAPWRPNVTVLVGQAVSLAGRPYIDTLGKRLGANFFDELDAEVATLELLASESSGALETMKARTGELKETLAEAHACLVSFRAAIAAEYPLLHPMRGHFGFGIKTNASSKRATLAALQMFIQAMKQYPAEAAAAYLGPGDLAKLEDFFARIPQADSSQENSKHERKLATSLLESTNYAVYSKLNLLKIAVVIDLADDRTAQKAILSPIPAGKRKRRERSGE